MFYFNIIHNAAASTKLSSELLSKVISLEPDSPFITIIDKAAIKPFFLCKSLQEGILLFFFMYFSSKGIYNLIIQLQEESTKNAKVQISLFLSVLFIILLICIYKSMSNAYIVAKTYLPLSAELGIQDRNIQSLFSTKVNIFKIITSSILLGLIFIILFVSILLFLLDDSFTPVNIFNLI